MSVHLWFFCVVLLINYSVGTVQDSPTPSHVRNDLDKKIDLIDGVRLSLPPANDTRRVMSFEIDTSKSADTGRGKQSKLLTRIMPLFIMPFILQSTIVPILISMLKFMLFKSFIVGKLALLLILFNAFRNQHVKGRDTHMADVVYGYHGHGMEYGAYFN